MQMNVYALLLAVPVLILGGIAGYSWRHRSTSGAPILGLMTLCFALGSAAYAFELMTPNLHGKLGWVCVRYVFVNAGVALTLSLALWFTGHKRWIEPHGMVLLFVFPSLTLIFLLTNDFHHLHYARVWLDTSGPIPMLQKRNGPIYTVYMVMLSSYFLGALLLLATTIVRKGNYLRRKQAQLIFAAVATPVVTNVLYLLGFRPFGILNPTVFGFVVFGLLMTLAVFRWQLLRLRPVARETLFAEVRDLMLVLDTQDVVTDLNPAAEDLFGPVAEVTGRPVGEVLTRFPEMAAHATTRAEATPEVWAGEQCFEMDCTPLSESGRKTVGRMIIIRDVTARKRAERERIDLERRLLNSQKMESLGAMAAGVAHDFNNLLHIIMANLDLAGLDLPAGSRAAGGLRSALQAAARAAELTHLMLTYLGRAGFNPAEADLESLVRESAFFLRATVPGGIRLQFEPGPAPLTVRGDSKQIRQLLANLLLNASEATGETRGTVTVRAGMEECGSATFAGSRTRETPVPGQYGWIEVSDTGCGMDENALLRLFDPFFTTKFTGRGLGMSAVLGIVETHRGAILVRSTPGRGTVVRVYFPTFSGAGETNGAAPEPTAFPVVPARPRTVLVVERDPSLLSLCRTMLERFGFSVLTASEEREALSALERASEEIGCAILDIPDLIGEEFAILGAIRRLWPGIPILVSSENGVEAMFGKTGESGVAGFVKKPYQLQNLRDSVERVMKSA